jgi:c-di-GMP-binding flagellar brake protein YcgR
MSLVTNPDRIYVTREYRAKIRLDQGEVAAPSSSFAGGSLPGLGAALMNLSTGGCCLRIARSELPFGLHPEHHYPSIKLLHPELDSSPIRGRVAWFREEPPHLLVGIQFLQMQPETQQSIQAYLGTQHPEVLTPPQR